MENFVSICAAEIDPVAGAAVDVSGDGDAVRRGMKTIRDVRKGSRRPLTDERKQRVADVYNAHDSGGIEAVVAAFVVSKSTAVRYISKARDAGLIEKRQK